MADGDRVEEFARSAFDALRSAANSLSELYAAGNERQRRAFHAGGFSELDKLHEWIWERREQVTVGDIIAYIQNAMNNYYTPNAPMDMDIRSSYQQNPANAQMPNVDSPYVPRDFGDLRYEEAQQPSSVPSANYFGASCSQVPRLGTDVGVYVPEYSSSQVSHLRANVEPYTPDNPISHPQTVEPYTPDDPISHQQTVEPYTPEDPTSHPQTDDDESRQQFYQ